MNAHQNARTTPLGRATLVRRVLEEGWTRKAAVAGHLTRLGLGRLAALEPSAPARRYNRARAGALIHLDTKKLARFTRLGHRITGDRRGQNSKLGWEFVHVALDDASRLAYVEVLPDERRQATTGLLIRALRWFKRQGIRVERVMTDNSPGYVARLFRKARRLLRLRHIRTRPYTPLRLPPVQDRLHNVRRQAGERQDPADIRIRHSLLLRKVGDRLRLTALDPPPPPVRPDERLDQRLVAARLRRRPRSPFGCDDQLSAAPALQPDRDADRQGIEFESGAPGHYSARPGRDSSQTGSSAPSASITSPSSRCGSSAAPFSRCTAVTVRATNSGDASSRRRCRRRQL
jgi:Integrase core domain/leucine-zipper of insertion element IS481